MNSERVKGALVFRALMWHRATSFRAKQDITKHSSTKIEGNTLVITVNWLDAKKEAEKATTELRKSFFDLALKASLTLVDVLAEETEEVKPKPRESIDFNGHMYYLQETQGDTRIYKRYDVYDKDRVINNPTPHKNRIHKELISETEYAIGDLLKGLTPPKI